MSNDGRRRHPRSLARDLYAAAAVWGLGGAAWAILSLLAGHFTPGVRAAGVIIGAVGMLIGASLLITVRRRHREGSGPSRSAGLRRQAAARW